MYIAYILCIYTYIRICTDMKLYRILTRRLLHKGPETAATYTAELSPDPRLPIGRAWDCHLQNTKRRQMAGTQIRPGLSL